MKRFMYLSVGVLCLSLSALIGFHMGNRSAQAQAPAPYVGFFFEGGRAYVMDANGDVWKQVLGNYGAVETTCGGSAPILTFCPDPPKHIGNIWGNGPVATDQSTWGTVKDRAAGKK